MSIGSIQTPIVIGIILTVLLLGGYGFAILAGESCDLEGNCRSGWKQLAALAPNALGDTVAGITSALAFIWIIVTVIMQSLELRAQREELRLAIDQYQRMAVAQESQLQALELQSRILDDDRKERASQRSHDFITAKMSFLRGQIARDFPRHLRASHAETGVDAAMSLGDPTAWPPDRFYWHFTDTLSIVERRIAKVRDPESSEQLRAAIAGLKTSIDEIRAELGHLLPLEKARLEGIGLFAFLSHYTAVAALMFPAGKGAAEA